MPLAPGTRLGPYEVTVLIGEGGMGKVWRAHHSGLKRDDALKVLPDAFVSDPERLARFQREAQVLPDGDSVLLSVTTSAGPARWDQGQIVAQSLKTGERTLLWEGGSDARFVPTGHLVYAVGDALFALAFDTNRLQVTGGPVSLVQGLARPANQGAATAAANYGISANGTLVYAAGARFTAGGGSVLNTLVWVNREGREELLSAPPRAYTYPRISPDGTKVALDIRDQQLDIWVWDIARETLTRLTFDPGEDEFPLWSS